MKLLKFTRLNVYNGETEPLLKEYDTRQTDYNYGNNQWKQHLSNTTNIIIISKTKQHGFISLPAFYY